MIIIQAILPLICILALFPDQGSSHLTREKRQGLNSFEHLHRNPPCGTGHFMALDPMTRTWYCIECPPGTHIFEREHFKMECEENGEGTTPDLSEIILPDGKGQHKPPCKAGYYLDYNVHTNRYFCGYCPEGTHMHQEEHYELECVADGVGLILPNLQRIFIIILCGLLCVYYRQ